MDLNNDFNGLYQGKHPTLFKVSKSKTNFIPINTLAILLLQTLKDFTL